VHRLRRVRVLPDGVAIEIVHGGMSPFESSSAVRQTRQADVCRPAAYCRSSVAVQPA
jgi:hypothetical protein